MNTQFFLETPNCSVYRQLPRTRMSAATICPKSCRVIFACRPTLQKQASVFVKKKDRYSSMQKT
ncbi:hypothetical protein AL058_00010 [Pseudomonas savastanoi pv. nerii]|nr:hypothetical protein AL058_00010 [Pseudomonas savastanoi pv. nerii]